MTETAATRILRLEFDIDQRDTDRAKREIKRLRGELQQMERAQQQQSRVGRRSSDTLEQNARAAKQAAEAYDRAANSADRLRSQQEQFDQVSRNVAIAGDVQSNLGALSGLAGAAGIPGGGGIAVTGEIIALIEELPRLKAAAAALPATINAAGKALGLGGGAGLIGAIGLAAAAATAAAISFKRAAKDIVDANATLNRATDAVLAAERAIADGTTVEAARERIESLRAEQEALDNTSTALREATPTLREAYDELVGGNTFLAGAIRQWLLPLEKAVELIGLMEKSLADFNIPFLDNDPGERLKSLADESDAAAREAAALEDAIKQGRISRREENNEVTELDKALERATKNTFGLSDQINLLEGALASGELSGREAAAAEAEIARLRDQATQTTKDAAEAEKSLLEQRFEQLGGTRRGGTRDGRTRRFGRSRSRGTAASRSGGNVDDEAQRLAELERDTAQQRAEAVRDANRSIVDAEIAARRDIEDIRREAARSEREALQQRNFLALANQRRDTADAISDRVRAAQRQRADINRELQRRNEDVMFAFRNETASILSVYQDFLGNVLATTEQARDAAGGNRTLALRNRRGNA